MPLGVLYIAEILQYSPIIQHQDFFYNTTDPILIFCRQKLSYHQQHSKVLSQFSNFCYYTKPEKKSNWKGKKYRNHILSYKITKNKGKAV